MSHALLEALLAEFRQKLAAKPTSIIRELTFPKLINKINVAIGMRRVGKTTCIFQEIMRLLQDTSIDISQILYINLEDDCLLPCSAEKLRMLIEDFYALYPQNHEKKCYIFLDEIQNVDNWATLIRRLLDSKNIDIYLCGSSSKLLSSEIHTSLRGRALATEVWPYSFREYLTAQDIQFSSDLLSTHYRDLLHYSLKRYLHESGFPEISRTPEYNRRQLLQDYVDVVIMRDIVERYNITHITLIKYMIKNILKNTGSTFSVNKFHHDLKTQGLTSAKNTLYDYLGYIEESYLAFSVPLYSDSIRKSQTNPRKIYGVDPGLCFSYTFGRQDNFGHLFENLVYIDLRRQGYKIYYYLTQERYEVDFYAISPLNEHKLIQVVWDDSDETTLQREKRALTSAEKELNITGELITPQNYIEKIWQSIRSL